MAQLSVSEIAEKYLNLWAEALMTGEIRLWELPPSVAQFFYLGYYDGRSSRQLEVDQLERAGNRLHNLAFETNNERRDRIEARLSQALEQATTAQWDQLDKDLAAMAGLTPDDGSNNVDPAITAEIEGINGRSSGTTGPAHQAA